MYRGLYLWLVIMSPASLVPLQAALLVRAVSTQSRKSTKAGGIPAEISMEVAA